MGDSHPAAHSGALDGHGLRHGADLAGRGLLPRHHGSRSANCSASRWGSRTHAPVFLLTTRTRIVIGRPMATRMSSRGCPDDRMLHRRKRYRSPTWGARSPWGAKEPDQSTSHPIPRRMLDAIKSPGHPRSAASACPRRAADTFSSSSPLRQTGLTRNADRRRGR